MEVHTILKSSLNYIIAIRSSDIYIVSMVYVIHE